MFPATDTKAKTLTVGGALLAALAASSCCIGPLVLAALGIGGAGAMSVLSAYRPYILILTATPDDYARAQTELARVCE